MAEEVRGGSPMALIVTGLMRSGTSPLAMILHQAGVTMGVHMRFPTHNKLSHLEWEDAWLADSLLAEILHPREEGRVEADIESYVRTRARGANGKPWGVKTPFLLPFMGALKLACAEADEPLTVVVTNRDYDDTIKSIRRQSEHLSEFERGSVLPRVTGIQEKIAPFWAAACEGAEIFDFKDIQERPRNVAERLAKLAGIKADIDVSIRGIRGREL
jgi:hypothetical protein